MSQNQRSSTRTVSPGLSGVAVGTVEADGAAGIGVGDGDAVSFGAWREAAGDGDGAFDRQVGHERILAGSRHLAENEERPAGLDLGGDVGLRM